jgi:hypothetical protein
MFQVLKYIFQGLKYIFQGLKYKIALVQKTNSTSIGFVFLEKQRALSRGGGKCFKSLKIRFMGAIDMFLKQNRRYSFAFLCPSLK